MLKGDLLFAVAPVSGMPLVFRTRHAATSHLDCLEDHVRAHTLLASLRVENVESGAREVREEEVPTTPTGHPPPARPAVVGFEGQEDPDD